MNNILIAAVHPFRTTPSVNMTDNMVRVTLDMPSYMWPMLRSHITVMNESTTKYKLVNTGFGILKQLELDI